jgi:hypothetical protein
MVVKYDSQPVLPVNVLAKKGRRERDHSGPCSVMDGVEEKNVDSKVDGGGGETSA